VPVVLDSSNQSDNFDFRNLPDISDENCGYLLEKIEEVINQMPPLEDCKHIKTIPNMKKIFIRAQLATKKQMSSLMMHWMSIMPIFNRSQVMRMSV
jgi:hypothetical protein